MSFKEGDQVRIIFRDAVGNAAPLNGRIVRKSEKDDHWAVSLGWIIMHIPEKDISHAEPRGDEQIQAGHAPLGQQEGTEGQKP